MIGAALLVAMVLLIGCRGGDNSPAPQGDTNAPAEAGFAAEASATAWTVELVVDEGDLTDTISRAWSPWAAKPEPLAAADDDFRSKILYTCPEAYDRQIGNVIPIRVVFWAQPRLEAPAGAEASGVFPIEVMTMWGEEKVVLQGHAVPNRFTLYLEEDDAAAREAGESSHAEFLRRLLESGSTELNEVVLVLNWERLGSVSFTYSLEGAADAIREAGQPCGMR